MLLKTGDVAFETDSNCLLSRCDQCGEAFARLDNLLRHSARHKHGKIFGCEICHKGFHRKVLNNAMISSHF